MLKSISFRRVLCALVLPLYICSCGAPNSSFSSTPKDYTDGVFPDYYPSENVSEFWDVSDCDVSKIDPNRKLICLTFDDAPSKTLENIVAVFAEFNENNPDCPASATVFCNGVRMTASSFSSLHAALALGFELGNHTHAHYDLTKLTVDELRAEIDQTDALLQQLDKKPRHLLRAPYGKTNAAVKSEALTPVISWTIDTLDWTGVDEERIYSAVWDNRFSGAIVLMHDGFGATVSAIKRLLPDLKADGYQVVTISQAARMHACKLKAGGEYIRLRKNGKS